MGKSWSSNQPIHSNYSHNYFRWPFIQYFPIMKVKSQVGSNFDYIGKENEIFII